MRYIVTPSGLVPAHEYRRPLQQRSDLPSPMLIRDGMETMRNPANGLLYESKSAFRRAVRAAGCAEVGNDAIHASPPEDRSHAADVGEALRQVRSGYKPKVTDTASEGWT